MITISMDEQGTFEHNMGSVGGIVMIAGVVYDDRGDSQDLQREKSRIRSYFEQVCQNRQGNYPQSLHMGKGQNSTVGNVKQEYSDTLGDFLCRGTYRGQPVPSLDGMPRSGQYYVYALVKSRKGKRSLKSSEISNLINETVASNLYIHMVEDALSHLLFYNNVFLDQEEASFDLATRVYKGDTGENLSQHTEIGYSTKAKYDGPIVYLTNADVFRTALERDMLTEDENDIKIRDLMARSIDYHDPEAGHEMLYLADAICTVLGYRNEYGSQKQYLGKVWDRMYKLTGENRLLYCYDDVDSGFTKAWKLAEYGDIYKAFSVFYDQTELPGEESKFYLNTWEPELLSRISRKMDVSSFTMAVRKFFEATQNNNVHQQKLLYIFEKLQALSQNSCFPQSQGQAILYDLYNAGISVYNHVGNPLKAQQCVDYCRNFSRFIGIEHMIRARNKEAVQLCCSFRYAEALKIAEENYDYYETTRQAQQKLLHSDACCNCVEFGVTCSQLGQVYSFLQDPRAEQIFHQALDLLIKGTPDYYITESYLLHYYLESKNKAQYEVYAKEYFGGHQDLEEQLHYLITAGSADINPVLSLKYAMYVYLKAIYTFYLDSISENLMEMLSDVTSAIKKIRPGAERQINGHPWQICYKYLAMICQYKDRSVDFVRYCRNMKDMSQSGGDTWEIVSLYGETQITRARNPKANLTSSFLRLRELLLKANENLGSIRSFEDLDSVITYTFR